MEKLKTLLASISHGIAIFVFVAGLLMAVVSMVYKVDAFSSVVVEVHAQSAKIAVIEQKTSALEALRAEDLPLLRQDIRDLREAISNLDRKLDRMRGK
jgi:uncharacterized protein YlxW (UPF0749 family)